VNFLIPLLNKMEMGKIKLEGEIPTTPFAAKIREKT
jgi:hypothetical protein